jgi:protein O-GlcNAc transferase
MEPENGGDHYSETLISLPNLSVYVEPPTIPDQPKSRAHFGLDPEAFVYLSCQSLFKYLPQYDRLFAQIIMGVPKARLVFIAHPSEAVTRRFKQRLAQTFADFQLDSGRICLFLPRMDTNDFLSLNLVCDAVLDPPGWSGGKTALESLYCGKPVVTLPGAFMRGRHTSAMLKQIGVAETIADDANHYVAIAGRLATHAGFLSAVTAKVKAGRHLLFRDQTVVNALEDFLKSVVRGKGVQ